ncbi:MAG: WD40 repeat domain-containing protein [Chloroflexota bacterium]
MSQESPSQQAARLLAQELLRSDALEVLQALAQAVARLQDEAVRQGVLQALEQVEMPGGVEQVWSAWQTTRSPHLEAILLEWGQPAAYPLELRLSSALKLGQTDWIEQAGPQVVESLLLAAGDPDPQIAGRAQAALQSLTDQAAQEEVCRWVIERDDPHARQAALQAGFAPRDPQRRALFYLLTEQWPRYEALDFDASLLKAVYQAADSALRGKIADLARRSGWRGYVEAFAGSRSARQLQALSQMEWEVILTVLSRHARWDEAWRLAQAAPPLWSARLLQSLQDAGWSPPQVAESQAFAKMARLGVACLEQGLPLERLPGPLRLLQGHTRPVMALAFDPLGEQLASGGADRSLRLWQPDQEQAQHVLNGHTGPIVSLVFSPDGALLASGGADRSLRLWQPADGAPVQILGGHAGEVSALAFSPDGALLASGDPAAVRLWQAWDGYLLHALPAPKWGAVSLAFSPDGAYLASAHADNDLNLWSVPDGEHLAVLKERVACWAFAGDRLVTGSSYGQARLWQVPTAAALQKLDGRVDGELLVVSPDGRWLAASDRQVIRLWELPSGEPLATLEAHSQRLTGLKASPDGRLLASASQDGCLRLWQVPEGVLLGALEGQMQEARCLVFNLQASLLAFADQRNLHLWPLENLGRLFRAPAGRLGVEALALQALQSPDLAQRERAWLEFTLELHRWRGRFDIEVGAAPLRIEIGDFDIELDG